jgi:hypothetical protein
VSGHSSDCLEEVLPGKRASRGQASDNSPKRESGHDHALSPSNSLVFSAIDGKVEAGEEGMARLKQGDNSRAGGNNSRNADIPSGVHAAAILPLSLVDAEGVKRGRTQQNVADKTKRHKKRRGRGDDEAGRKAGGKGRSDAGDKADGGGRLLHPLTKENILAISAPDTQLEEQSVDRIYAWLSTSPGDDEDEDDDGDHAAGALLVQPMSSSSHAAPVSPAAAVPQNNTHSGFFVHAPRGTPRAQTAATASNSPPRIPLSGQS